ncbi:MAG: hypothetical protein KF857_11045 [Fimbriimonadaceae bacterium]|nr:hypothetical protein [Fimbriimonadaceae bacterium]
MTVSKRRLIAILALSGVSLLYAIQALQFTLSLAESNKKMLEDIKLLDKIVTKQGTTNAAKSKDLGDDHSGRKDDEQGAKG